VSIRARAARRGACGFGAGWPSVAPAVSLLVYYIIK
jgi:hypothetical protein